MASLLVSLSVEGTVRELTMAQIFKILAPFVFLSVAFATLNRNLGMPPFALFLVALSLTDGTATLLSYQPIVPR